jgi:hypothetical protein
MVAIPFATMRFGWAQMESSHREHQGLTACFLAGLALGGKEIGTTDAHRWTPIKE